MKGVELIKKLNQVKHKNIRQLLCRIKVSITLTKLLQLSQEIREYSLNYLVRTHVASGSQLVLPPQSHSCDVTTKDNAYYGTFLAKTIPKQLYRAHIPQTQHLALEKKSRTAGGRQTDELMMLEASRSEILAKVSISKEQQG